MKVWLLLWLLYGEPVVSSPYTAEECIERMHDQRGPEDNFGEVAYCWHKDNIVIPDPDSMCQDNDETCESYPLNI